MPDFGKIMGPLIALTKRDSFSWLEKATTTFNTLKQTMISPQVFALPNFNKPFIIETDASGIGIAVLQQEGRSIAFTSKALCLRNQTLSSYEKKMLVTINAIHKW